MLKKSLVLLLFLYAISGLGAATVSVLVIETGQMSEGPVSRYSILWENGLMEVFFESGHIVSNAPIMQLFQKPDEDFPYEAERDFDNAKDGGMQYFLVAVVDNPAPSNVTLCLFNTKTRELVQKMVHADAFKTSREEQEGIKNTIRALAAQLR
jgi:hypothetical protein